VGFEFNSKFECKQNQIICPNADKDSKYFIQFTQCVKTDFSCQYSLPDGYCSACNEGFHALNGKCIKIQFLP
jgi:hypothetical protein